MTISTTAPAELALELALELAGVSARYEAGPSSDAVALRDVSLSIRAGEVLMVLGGNGAGKSTLLRLMAGTLAPSSGEARLFGASVARQDRRTIAREVAVVAQTEEVRFAFSVRDVVLMGRAPRQEGWMRASDEDLRVSNDAMKRFDLEALADRSVDHLSGGERKRVAIARAFAQRSRVLLLDEPTAFLDVRHQVALFEEIRELARMKQTTTVVVTHDLQLAAAHGSRIALLKQGRLVAEGTVDDVLTDARLTETFDWPIRADTVSGSGERVFVPQRR